MKTSLVIGFAEKIAKPADDVDRFLKSNDDKTCPTIGKPDKINGHNINTNLAFTGLIHSK
ncbi:hypothetical protein J6I92_03040 [Pseudidiomarina sp. 1APR75-15]|uniref:Uncharacterized protein n=1 Tax=Pseudidiomarina terrestris TaxID=2820060 RepID=A0ABT8MFX1_9GAMM|nr:hypothetical protein [Pseudidiomarina sp. 1APR75-15]